MNPLKELRVRRGLTQLGLCKRSTLALTTIQRLEGEPGEYLNAQLGTLIKLARALDVTPTNLVELLTEGSP